MSFLGYERSDHVYCEKHSDFDFNSRLQAEQHCNREGARCKGVLDEHCNDDDYYLCYTDILKHSHAGSCVYSKFMNYSSGKW